MSDTQIATVEVRSDHSNQLARVIDAALKQKADFAMIEKFYELQERAERDNARRAFIAAKAAFKAEPILLTKDKENKQYKSMYTTLGNLVNTVTPFLSKHGLSVYWTQDQSQPGHVLITCYLEHALGHKESNPFLAPIDTSGQKNPIQQIKSAITYGRGTTLEGILGMASSDANVDDDGNGHSAPASDPVVDKWLDRVSKIKTVEEHKEVRNEVINDYTHVDLVPKVLATALREKKETVSRAASP